MVRIHDGALRAPIHDQGLFAAEASAAATERAPSTVLPFPDRRRRPRARFRVYAPDDTGTWARVGRAFAHLKAALACLRGLGDAEIRERLPSGREVLFAVKTEKHVVAVTGHTLTV